MTIPVLCLCGFDPTAGITVVDVAGATCVDAKPHLALANSYSLLPFVAGIHDYAATLKASVIAPMAKVSVSPAV